MGLFAFGLFTKLKVNDKVVPYLAIASPVICAVLDYSSKSIWNYSFGYELLMINGFITFAALWFFRKKEINTVSNSNFSNKAQQYDELVNLLDSHLMTAKNWTNFKSIFDHEQKNFIEHLDQNFPGLTESNLKIIYLLKLGLTNIEISQLLGISADSVKKSKQRLKKKYENFELIFKDNDD